MFLATSAIALSLGILKWFGPVALILSVQIAAVIAVLVLSKGTAWRGVIIGGFVAAVPFVLNSIELNLAFVTVGILWIASLGAWFGGGLAASKSTKDRYRFLRWSWLLASVWFVAVVVIVMIDLELNPPNW